LPATEADIADLFLLQEVVEEAGQLARAFYGKTGLDVWDKSLDNPVTEADLAVNELVRRRLLSARPDYGWLSEENALGDHRRDQNRVWVLDPIDGTRAFMKTEPDWCVGIGVVDRGEVRASVVAAPIFEETYTAVAGGQACRNGAPIKVSTASAVEGCRMVATEAMFSHPAWRDPWPVMEFARPKPNATLLRMCWVASGQWDATIALVRKSDWDLAPASLIVEQAGGKASTHLGEPFRFNRTVPAQRSILAAGKPLHSLLKARCRSVRLADPNAPEMT
jgi:myo-inositol-1(or 4)-monophosphatase